jgi:hypothetical protein
MAQRPQQYCTAKRRADRMIVRPRWPASADLHENRDTDLGSIMLDQPPLYGEVTEIDLESLSLDDRVKALQAYKEATEDALQKLHYFADHRDTIGPTDIYQSQTRMRDELAVSRIATYMSRYGTQLQRLVSTPLKSQETGQNADSRQAITDFVKQLVELDKLTVSPWKFAEVWVAREREKTDNRRSTMIEGDNPYKLRVMAQQSLVDKVLAGSKYDKPTRAHSRWSPFDKIIRRDGEANTDVSGETVVSDTVDFLLGETSATETAKHDDRVSVGSTTGTGYRSLTTGDTTSTITSSGANPSRGKPHAKANKPSKKSKRRITELPPVPSKLSIDEARVLARSDKATGASMSTSGGGTGGSGW